MSESTASDDDRTKEWIGYWNDGHMSQMHVNTSHCKITEHYDKLVNGKEHARILFPLCGDVVDMIMLGEKGHSIVGVECSELGVKTFFGGNNIAYEHEDCPQVQGKLFKSKDGKYTIYCCDLFNFSRSVGGQFDAIVDFGSMGAILKEELATYADLMKTLMKPDCRHFIESFIYDIEKFPDSRPHCFILSELQKLYGDKCTVEKIDEGPNPYEDDSSEELLTNSKEKQLQESEDKTCEHNMEGFPDITGAAYFIIQPK